MLYPPETNRIRPTSKTISFQDIHRHNLLCIKDENYHPNQQLNENTMNEVVNTTLTNCPTKPSDPAQDENMSDGTKELQISIRRVGMEDHLNIVKLFQVIFCSNYCNYCDTCEFERIIYVYIIFYKVITYKNNCYIAAIY